MTSTWGAISSQGHGVKGLRTMSINRIGAHSLVFLSFFCTLSLSANCPCDCRGPPKVECPCSCTCEAGQQAVTQARCTCINLSARPSTADQSWTYSDWIAGKHHIMRRVWRRHLRRRQRSMCSLSWALDNQCQQGTNILYLQIWLHLHYRPGTPLF